jgi:protein phosphatase
VTEAGDDPDDLSAALALIARPESPFEGGFEGGVGRELPARHYSSGEDVLAVRGADGVCGPAGDLASTTAIDALKPLEALAIPAEDLLSVLADAVDEADQAIGRIDAAGDAVTTLTALLWSGSRLALVHIGDTRAHVLRDGELFQITHDHTYVQSLVDEGRLTADEAASHPQRSLLAQALTGTGGARPDLSLHEAVAGDRYLLCSDGLSAVVPAGSLRDVLTGSDGPQQALDGLVARAYAAGAPDNIACVVADVVTLETTAATGRQR